ncbi:DNA topoisomerase (ATP-hydrolyzing) subunit B [Lyticum sinuosum]|uniref:DNA topoisomerase (ATP-hydrolyzing) subunit B n=1 Tax=Lyticum sinuosum TaxID=1332059 RepID=UPI002ACD3EA0|nr:DNA topoisomerase (ATP-hydrolyzing) subunit B [Lyticum sinuosum]
MKKSSNHSSYTSQSIQVLRGLDPVKKRPGMYIGDVGSEIGLYNTLREVIDNSVDESMAGYCDKIDIIINKDESITISDNGRGIPVDIHAEEGISAAELIMTKLHAGGKFDNNSYKISGGLHGVGVSVVNALSAWMEVKIYRDGNEHFMRFENGDTVQPLTIIGQTKKRGTTITYAPSPQVFAFTSFDFEIIEQKIRETAFLNSNIKFSISDKRLQPNLILNLCYEGGIKDFAEYLDRSKKLLHKTIYSRLESEGIIVEVAMQWNDSYSENIQCFTNNIKQSDGGTHLTGLRAALTRSITNYISEIFKKNNKLIIQPEDIREGFTAVLSVKVPDPKFSSQTKDKLVSGEIRPIVENICTLSLNKWLEENPNEARIIANRIIDASIARDAAKKARDISRKKSNILSNLVGKLASNRSKDPSKSELFIVEGDSAGGTAKQARDREFQAIFPLRGKILNVERARIDKIYGFTEIVSLVNALETGIGKDEFDINKLRYHKIILMTDADVDGSHILTLLMTFFFRYMPDIISKGYLYIAEPPLYKIRIGQKDTYLRNNKEMNDYFINSLIKNINIYFTKNIKNDDCNVYPTILQSPINFNEQKQNLQEFFNLLIWFNDFISSQNFINNHKISQALWIAPILEYIFENSKKSELKDYIDWANQVIELLNKEEKLNNTSIIWSFDYDNLYNFIFQYKYKEAIFKQEINLRNLIIKIDQRTLNTLSKIKVIFSCEIVELQIEDLTFKSFFPLSVIDYMFDYAKKGLHIQRFKGLGEMNPDQLWETTMNIQTRNIKRLTIKDAIEASNVFDMLMGESVLPRRQFIEENARKIEYLDT